MAHILHLKHVQVVCHAYQNVSKVENVLNRSHEAEQDSRAVSMQNTDINRYFKYKS